MTISIDKIKLWPTERYMQLPSLSTIELFLILHSLRHWIEPNPTIFETTDTQTSYAWSTSVQK